MGYRLEAWNDPGSSLHEVIIKDVPISLLGAGQQLSGFASGSLTISSDFPRLDEINDPSNNVETLLRLFRDEDHLCSFYATSRQRAFHDVGNTVISGEDINSGLIHGVVYPFDYEVGKRTKQPDWIFGVDNRKLENEGFEENIGDTSWEDGELDGWRETAKKPDSLEVIEDPAEARTGDFCLRIDGDVFHTGGEKRFTCKPGGRYVFDVYIRSATTGRRLTAGISISSGYISHHSNPFTYNGYSLAELENVPRNPAKNGKPGGSTDGTWQKIHIDVTVGSKQESFTVLVQEDHHGGGDGPVFFVDDFTITGPLLGLVPWHDSAHDNSGLATFEQDTLFTFKGTFSAHVITNGTGGNADGFEQHVEDVEAGLVYTWGVWIYQNSGSDKNFTAVFKRPDGPWVNNQVTTVPTATWTFCAVTAKMTGDEVWPNLRVQQAGALEFWADDGVMGEGLQEATAGEIIRVLLDPIKTRGALGWVSLADFTDLKDASGVDWDSTLRVRVNRGRDMAQVMSLLANFGIEWFIHWTGSDYRLRPYNRNGAGTDRTVGDSPAVFTGRGLTKAHLQRTSAGPNVILAEGDEGILNEEEDTALSAAYGRRESYAGTSEILGTLGEVTSHSLNLSRDRKFGIKAEFSDADMNIWDDLQLGDLVDTQLPPDISGEDIRVVKINTVIAPGGQAPSHQVDFGRPVYIDPPDPTPIRTFEAQERRDQIGGV